MTQILIKSGGEIKGAFFVSHEAPVMSITIACMPVYISQSVSQLIGEIFETHSA